MMISAPHTNSEGALSVSLAADNPAPKPHFEVCLLGSLIAPNITGPIPWEPDSETDTCLWKVYWKMLSASTSARQRREHVWAQKEVGLHCRHNKSLGQSHREFWNLWLPQSGARGLGVYRPPLTIHWIQAALWARCFFSAKKQSRGCNP